MTDEEKLKLRFEVWWDTEILAESNGIDENIMGAFKEIARAAWNNGAYVQTIISEGEMK